MKKSRIKGRKIVNGYIKVKQPDHSRADPKGYVREHILIAEKALGKSLPHKVEVHHFNGTRSDNRNSNLIICQDSTYHQLLHARQKALRGCGNPNYRRCWICKQWDDLQNMRIPPKGKWGVHRACERVRAKQWLREKRKKDRLAAKMCRGENFSPPTLPAPAPTQAGLFGSDT